ncbi:MAG: UDP-N,N'-diacetylbacillosamine 2-epimerase (hydrolyzing) [Phycisphaerae bacterium]|nr:UDP-N,N'-diacetylbacillosamine 2-epimerase (hydrolyzing) [Phycisphaerae bacterium]
MSKRRIAVVTGSRAEYGLLRPVVRALRARRRLQPEWIVTGMHLVRRFGYTVREMEADGESMVARVVMQRGGESGEAQADALARGVAGIARVLHQRRSDLVLVLGDRIEALAGALAGVVSNCFVGHIHGGDVAPGYLDDTFRHAITKLAHLHFAATAGAARRIKKLGERPSQIHVVGAPGLDDLRDVEAPSAEWWTTQFGFPARQPVAVILHHAIGRTATVEQRAMQAILQAVDRQAWHGLIIYPNSDPGYSGIVRAIESTVRKNQRFRAVRSLPRQEYIQALRGARVLIGNSSSGVIESASLGVPVINIGSRQDGRERCGPNVLDCTETASAIAAALQHLSRRRDNKSTRSVYGDGKAGERIAELLARFSWSDKLRTKQITY